MAAHRSVVKWFDAKKGYGFLVNPNGGTDVFVHYSSIDNDKRFKTLRTGQVVDFDMQDGPKGLHAYNVTALEEFEPTEAPLGHLQPSITHGLLDGQMPAA